MSNANGFFTPFADTAEIFKITPELIEEAGLIRWAEQFQLGTAGYRDLLDPADFFNITVPFNGLSLAIILKARAQLAIENGYESLHVGGEVRPLTQEFIDLAARIYAASGIAVHLRPEGIKTTPIWLSSFGVFHYELDGGENFTASHSQNYKGGWKPMSASGGQLLEMAGQIADRVRLLVTEAKTSGLTIVLAASNDNLIKHDFDPVEAYVKTLKQVVPEPLMSEVQIAGANGFKAAFCTEGGSMAKTATRIFEHLDIPVAADKTVFLTHEQESETYHGIGILDGVNHGVDPGKWQVYKHVGAQELLKSRQCDIFFIWDPDGDRFNMVTIAPIAVAQEARLAGMEVDSLDDERCLVFFKPNQIYFMLTALKIASMHEDGELNNYNWIVATTYPTSKSIGEVATAFNRLYSAELATYQVPVGFKYFAALVADLENQVQAKDTGAISATDVTGVKTNFGPRPRLLMMAEESGGAAMGSAEPVISCNGKRSSLAPKEKDGMQIGLMSLCLAARLFNQGSSIAEYYLELLKKYDTKYRFYERLDVTLFDESLQGAKREQAKDAGNQRKLATVAFFAGLEGKAPAEAAQIIKQIMPASVELPSIERVFHAGDGTYIEFGDLWFELRASGTDAVLRYYMEGKNASVIASLNEAFTKLDI